MYTQTELDNASKVISYLAAKHSVPETQVRAEIQKTITFAKSNPDPSAQAMWRHAGFSNEIPTIEEYVVWITKITRERLGLK